MPVAHCVKSVAVERTPRVLQLEGLFELPPTRQSSSSWDVNVPIDDWSWQVGLIVGPSGSGKSTIARELFGDHLVGSFPWPEDRSLVDGFPSSMSIKDITALLSSVGFSSPPSWLRPFRCLSNGEQFRATMARALCREADIRHSALGIGHSLGLADHARPAPTTEAQPMPNAQCPMPTIVLDEFTSVVDRQVARIGSAALQKAVRRRGQRLIAVTCHYDVEEWLQPDWVLEMPLGTFTRRSLRRRPAIELEIRRVHPSAWDLFKHHHYLNTSIHRSATCFAAFVEGAAAAFSSALSMPGPSGGSWREHRTVCLPDYQGVGIGNALSEFVAGLFRATGKPYFSLTSNPAMIQHRARSPLWYMHRKPSRSGAQTMSALNRSTACNRLVAGFRFVGPALLSKAREFGLVRH